MEKSIKDYLHFYLGCEIECIAGNSDNNYKGAKGLLTTLATISLDFDKWKLILRPLSSMTKSEAIHVVGLTVSDAEFNSVKVEPSMYGDLIVLYKPTPESDYETANANGEMFFSAEQFVYLLKQGFDLFDLIEDGLAIDKNNSN